METFLYLLFVGGLMSIKDATILAWLECRLTPWQEIPICQENVPGVEKELFQKNRSEGKCRHWR